jgi:hypothetical protein
MNTENLKKYPLLADNVQSYLHQRNMWGMPVAWADIAELEDRNIRNYGIEGALQRAPTPSPRRSSSGKSHKMTRKVRKEHYKRKAQLEEEKEKQRLRAWMTKNPNGDPMDWVRREQARRERKERERKSRKVQSNKK